MPSLPAADAGVVSALVAASQDDWLQDCAVRVVGVVDHRVDLEIRRGEDTGRVWLAMPSSGRPMPWMESEDPAPEGWVAELRGWLDEEMATGGLEARATRRDPDGVRRLMVCGYGLQVQDQARHERLQRAVGPHGWAAPGGRRRVRRAYALEWALDQVEDQLRQPGRDDSERRWTLVAPGRVPVLVSTSRDGDGELVLCATVGPRWSRQTAGRRLPAI